MPVTIELTLARGQVRIKARWMLVLCERYYGVCSMIASPAKNQIWIAARVTDIRLGFTVGETPLEQAPLSGHVFAFRGRRGDLIKLPCLELGRSR